MAASLISSPASPASVYRPLQFKLQRDDQTGGQVGFIRPATAGDVTTYGAGLAVGDILVEHAPLGVSPVPIAVGQTVLFTNCELYSGIHTITKIIESDGGTDYFTVEAPDYGSVVPTSPVGTVRIWLDRYAMVMELSVYTDPTQDPQLVLFRGTPDLSGFVYFDAGKPIRAYFNDRIFPFCKVIPGGVIVQDAHGYTALFYRVRIAEVYALPGEVYPTDPFAGDPGSDIIVDDIEDEADEFFRVGVNAVHPYHSAILTWETADLAGFVIGGTSFERRFLTHAPRSAIGAFTGPSLIMATTDQFRIHMLTDSTLDYEVDYLLRVFDVTGSPTLIDTVPIVLTGATSAISVAVGPADLSPFMTLTAKYRAYISNVAETALSEPIEVTIDDTCKEVRRPVCVLGLLGGVDHYSFTGREIVQTKNGVKHTTLSSGPLKMDVRQWLVENLTGRGKVETLQKPYDTGTSYDYMERAYKGPNAVLRLSDTQLTPMIIDSDSVMINTGPFLRPVTIEYRLGADQLTQQV